eukprot:GCRY01002934.1.p1 GENE.GCRY01002934.1~~GCRY01002934.1.p1  ORF type:complete len:1341 (-),score=431.05 GCRY01002934.1:225-4226(-)
MKPLTCFTIFLLALIPLVTFANFAVGEEIDLASHRVPSQTDTQTLEREEQRISYEGLSIAERKLIEEQAEAFEFQAEVHSVMSIVVNSLYSHKDVFLRELVSNASDALDKIRFLALKNPALLADNPELAVYIRYDPESQILSIRDTGIGMTKQDLVSNLGTLARSGSREFIEKIVEGKEDASLIGQFGIGFYSVFLAGDRVTVISKHHDDEQYVWVSDNDSSFTVTRDPRGNTLGRGTEILINIRDDSLEYLEAEKLKELVMKYSEFITFPIYLFTCKEETVELPKEDEPATAEKEEEEAFEEIDVEIEEEEEEEEYDDELDDFDWFDSSVVGNLLAGMSAFKQGTRHVLMAASPQSIIITASDTAEAEKVQEEKLRARALFLEMMDNNSSDGSDISRQDFDKAVFCLKHNEEEEGEEEKEEEKKHLEDKANLLSHEIMVLHQSDLRDYLWENVKEEFLKKKLEGKKKKNKGGESEEGESEVTLESVEPLFAEDDVGFCEIAAAVLTPTRTPGPKEGEAEAEAASEDEPGVVYLHVVWVNGVYTVWRVAKIAHEPSPKANMQLVAVNRIIPAGNQKIDYAVFLNDGEFLLISTKRNLLCHIYWLRHAIPQKISVFWGHDSDLLDATLYSATPQSSENEESVSGWAAKLRKKAAKTLSQFGAAAAKVPEIVLFTSSFDMSVRKWKINAETTTKIMNPTGDCVKHIPLYFSSEFTMPKQSSYLVEDLKDRALTGLGNKLGAAKMMKLNSGIQKLKAKFHDLPTSIGVTHSGAIQLLELLPPVFHESGSLQLEALSACDEGDLYLWDVLTGTSIAIPTGEDMKASAICGTETHFLVIVDDVENEEEDDDDYDFDDEYGIYDNDSEEECEEEEGEGQDDEAQEAEDGPTEETEEAGGEEEGGEEEAGNEYWGGVDEDYSFEPPIDVRMFQRFKGGEARMQRTLENSMDWISIEKKYTGDEKCYIEPVLCASPDGQLAVLFHKGTFAIIHIPTLSEVYSDNWGMLNNGIQHVKWAGKNKNAVLGPDENGFFTQHLVVACQAECDNHEGAGVLKDGGLVRVRVRYAHDHGDGSYFPERDDMKMEVDYVAGSLWSEDGFDDVQVSADGSTIVAIDGTLVFVGQIDHDNSAFAISVVARNRDSDSDEDLEDPENASPNFFDFYEGWVDAISVSDDGELVVFCAGNNTLYGLRRGDCDGSPCYDYHWEHTMENIESIDKIKALSKDVIAVTDGLKGTFILGLKTEHTECEGPDDNAYTEAVLLSAFHPGKDKYCSFDACHVPEANAKTLRPHWMAGGESDKFDGVVYSITGGLAGSPAIVRTDLQLPKASTPEDDEEKGLGE